MKKTVIILSVCLVVLLGVCAVLHFTQTPPAPEPQMYTVQFDVLGNIESQQVAEGAAPAVFNPSVNGLQILGWTDPQGQAVDPFTTPITGNICYTADTRLALTEHVPYLFTDSEGNLRPDEPLDHSALTMALEALVAPEAKGYLPQVAVISSPINRDMLMEILSVFYEKDAIAEAFPEGAELTRAVFAKGMNLLLGRSVHDTFTLEENPVIPMDLTLEREDAWELMEASVIHTPAEQARTWAEVELPSSHEPGFMLIEGQLYYVQEDHFLLRDGYVGTLYFNPEGRYTSGNDDLDNIVVTLLKDMTEQNPESTRFELLRIVYDYCHQNFSYRRTIEGNPEVGTHGWETQRALDMFETGKGNCYSFSAIFWALSRGLGYDTRAISGVVLSDEQPHSWCFIELDGKDYIFDPQWQYDYTRRGITEHDMFYLPTDNLYFWGYQWFE